MHLFPRIMILLLLAGCAPKNAPPVIQAPPPAPPPRPPECTKTFSWKLTEDRLDLTAGTIYVVNTPEEIVYEIIVDPYILAWVHTGFEPGEYWAQMTVSVGDVESLRSNTTYFSC